MRLCRSRASNLNPFHRQLKPADQTMTTELPVQALYRRCDPALIDFAASDQALPVEGLFGQQRAVEALNFGVDIAQAGFNVFVMSDPASGSREAVRGLLETAAARLPLPSDWCYVNNFAEQQRPRLLALPAGVGMKLRRDMQRFTDELAPAIDAAFESEEFRTRIEGIQEDFKKREEKALNELGEDAKKQGIALLRTPRGFVFAPIQGDEPMAQDAFNGLPAEEKERISRLLEEFGERMQKLSHQFPRWRREMQAALKQLGRETMTLAAGHLIADLKEQYAGVDIVIEYLDQVLADVVEFGEGLREKRDEAGELEISGDGLSLQRYHVNLLVDRDDQKTAPVIYEDHPTFPNLVGRMDYLAHMGTWVTNFTLIRCGALHRANGGFLMLDALKVLSQPYAWDGLKRALKASQVRVESLGQVLGFASNLALEAQPMPLSCKVVLFGEPQIYYLLKAYDAEFDELFKVAADFENDVERSDDSTRRYAIHLAAMVRDGGLRPFDRSALARLIEHSARLAGDAERLSTATRRIADLMQEANHHAGLEQRGSVTAVDVEHALEAQIHRGDRYRDRYQETILRGTFLIDSTGRHVGQINALAVVELGDFLFAHPVRITATFRLGEGEVVDIERETELGGPIHSKGVMVISSFLASRYASEMPLSLSASLVFEQSYGPVEGDSASLAELCALLSALAGAPIKQSLAVTGSVNQFGRVQAIGGVNEKIEGFFDICRLRGLTGEQGVIIPESNVKHLMLRQDVVAAAAAGQFHIHAVASVEEAIELLTGVPAGEPDAQGVVPPDSINYLVAVQLTRLFEKRQEISANGERLRHQHKAGKT
jgi:predicted ATP-dependent protease